MTLLPDWLARCAANFPDKLALRCGGTDWSFAELDRQATRLAHRLAARGVCAGDRVALLAQNGLPFAATVHALTRLGAVLVPLNTRLTSAELAWQVADVRATWLMADAHFTNLAREIRTRHDEHEGLEGFEELETSFSDPFVFFPAFVSRPFSPVQDVILHTEIDLDAPQAIIYTSGTTGQPKGAIITYGMQWWGAVGSALNLGHDPADRWLACTPFFHVSGLSILWRSVIYGIGVVIHPRFAAAAINRSIREDGVTIISVVTAMVRRMLDDLDEACYPPTFRCLLLGGGPAPVPLLEACAARSIPVVQTYGMTETCAQAVTLAPADALRKIGSAGKPLAAVQLRVMGEAGPAGPDEVGEIQLRGPTITPGYAERPDATARAFTPDGWFATGDLGYLDAEGYLYVLDRRADLIISGGENVYPAEIEAALLAHPAVAEAGVCGVADAAWGRVPFAFVVPQPGALATPEELCAFLAARLARYKVPRAIHLVAALPRNAAGKLLRRELPRLLPGDDGAAP
jgi:O-succinylbenzoic acid--CoA ligase